MKERKLEPIQFKEAYIQPIRRLVLASSSPRRKELVALLGLSLPVYILPSDADESVPEQWSPDRIVEELSVRKALATVSMLQDNDEEPSIIVGADTIVVLDGEALGKPKDRDEAYTMLSRLQGRSHEVYTGVACVARESGRTVVKHRKTLVFMKPLSEETIRRYIATGESDDKAGAYGIQGYGAAIVDRIDGCYFNVVGLPVSLLADMLHEFGIVAFENG
ncbi:nucleoside triphosphate pyrophosphatase [Paenibacillus sp. NEAU-GSW1]|uniref:Maf family protein n=1 Tax=Paenibacillus sp. NEAU-GSW1 TaxID=2682486 RepID=UPI0012E31BF0|nr:Maf family protein [Paenibacillus sp. NEAU-GSW1]MUT64523.1 septum formation protein Maf [Paenibacillus sp. NEAU-GSW1]